MLRWALLLSLCAVLLASCGTTREVLPDDPHWRVPRVDDVNARLSDEAPAVRPVELGTDVLEMEGLDATGRRQLPGAVDDRSWSPEMGLLPSGVAAATPSAPATEPAPRATGGKPDASAKPDATAKPDASAKPDATAKPDASAKPDATAKPKERPGILAPAEEIEPAAKDPDGEGKEAEEGEE